MAPQRHRYTKCILFTGQRANKSNERVVCKYCSEAESPQWALQNALLCNTKKLVKSHLRRCRFFRAAQANAATADESIVFTEDEDDSGTDGRKSNKHSAPTRTALVLDATNANKSPFESSKKNESNKRQKTDRASGAASTLAKLTRAGAATPLTPTAGAASDQDALERLLLNATLANGWSFAWLDQRASTQLLQYLQPSVRLPSAEALAGRILKSAGEKEADHVWTAVQRERIGCTVVLDAWKQVMRQGALGVMLTTSQGEVLVWDSKPVQDTAIETLVTTELAALGASNPGVSVVALVADSSDAYAAMRRRLRRSRRDLMVLPCAAHQLNAFVGEMFSFVPTFLTAMHEAMDIAVAVQRSNNLQTRIWQKQLELERPQVVLPPLPDPLEWDSLRNLTASLLAMKDTLMGVATEENVGCTFSTSAVRAIHSDDGFWQPLAGLNTILFHVSSWLAILRLHHGRLHYVPLMNHAIAATLQHQLAPEIGSSLLERLEARWDEWEHPLTILAVVLNPAFGWKCIDSSSGVTLMRVSCWARYYFESFFGTQPHNLPNEVIEYVEGDKFWCSPASIASFSTPVYRPPAAESVVHEDAELFARLSFKVVQYWKSCSTDCPELSKLALRIFAVSVTSASTDGLFAETTASMETSPSTASEQSDKQLQLAATRVRARAKYEQRHDGVPAQYAGDYRPVAEEDTAGHSREVGSMSREGLEVLQALEHAKLDELLKRWDDQAVQNVDLDVERESPNENEAINSMYIKIHPADDKFSKYSIQTLFQSA